jgi:hypothetical protein
MCGCRRNRGSYVVRLPGGTEVKQTSERAAKSFAVKHPGSRVIKK